MAFHFRQIGPVGHFEVDDPRSPGNGVEQEVIHVRIGVGPQAAQFGAGECVGSAQFLGRGRDHGFGQGIPVKSGDQSFAGNLFANGACAFGERLESLRAMQPLIAFDFPTLPVASPGPDAHRISCQPKKEVCGGNDRTAPRAALLDPEDAVIPPHAAVPVDLDGIDEGSGRWEDARHGFLGDVGFPCDKWRAAEFSSKRDPYNSSWNRWMKPSEIFVVFHP